MTRDPIFKRLPGDVLSQLAKTLTFDPLASDAPAKLLSSLSEAERIQWLDAHRNELEEHLSFVGSSLLSYVFGGAKSYREIVIEMAKKLGAPHCMQDGTAEIERRIIGKVWNDTVAQMTPAQKEELMVQTEALATKYGVSLGKEVTGLAALTAAQMSGFGVYLVGSTLLGALNGALGLGLGFGAFTGLSSLISTVIGPIGWAALGLFTILKLGGPNYKKLLPAIILIATARAAEDPGVTPQPIIPPGLAAAAAIQNSQTGKVETSSRASSRPANPVIRQLQWEVTQVTERHRSHKKHVATTTTHAIRRCSRLEKTVFDLKNGVLKAFAHNLVPEMHYLDLEPDDRALIDELFVQHQTIEAESQRERETVERLRGEHRKRERRLLHKGKLQKVDDELKKNFDREFPTLAEIARRSGDSRHYLEFTPEEQAVLKELEGEERDAALQDELQHKRLAELVTQHAKSLGQTAKRERLTAAPSPSPKKIERTRSDYRHFFPSLLFSDRALERLCSMEEPERGVFYQQFRLMEQGKSDAKHEVERTEPKIFTLDAGNSGKVYYRRDEAKRFVVELVGYKHRQDADYARLQAKGVLAHH